jgi:hypothetical protein
VNAPADRGDSTAPVIDAQLADSIVWIMRNGVGIQIMETLAVGAVLTAFAIQLFMFATIIGLYALHG